MFVTEDDSIGVESAM